MYDSFGNQRLAADREAAIVRRAELMRQVRVGQADPDVRHVGVRAGLAGVLRRAADRLDSPSSRAALRTT